MRSLRLLAAVTSILTLATACGDGGGTPPPDNARPVANFSEVCTQLSCVFTDASTDEDGNETITSRSWAFGDNGTSTETSPTHAYAVAGTYVVVLTVTDDQGETDDFTKAVTVTAPAPVNTPPTAAFTFTCDAGVCSFNSSTSTDAEGPIASFAWDFGDPASGTSNTSTEANPTHTYTVTAATNFNVRLTVTDAGGLTDDVTQTVLVQPPPPQLCSPTTPNPSDNRPRVICTLSITQRSTLTFTMSSHDCELGGNRFEVTQPVQRTLFFNGCSEILEPAGKQYPVTDAAGAPRVFDAGTQLQVRFTQGVASAGSPPPGTPAIRLDGAWPSWTVNIDDGGNPGPGEPDFNDIVLTAAATRVQ